MNRNTFALSLGLLLGTVLPSGAIAKGPHNRRSPRNKRTRSA
jgi:hypothetical protein